MNKVEDPSIVKRLKQAELTFGNPTFQSCCTRSSADLERQVAQLEQISAVLEASTQKHKLYIIHTDNVQLNLVTSVLLENNVKKRVSILHS